MSDQKKEQFEIHVDSHLFKVSQSHMTGAEIKALVKKDATYQLFLEGHGGNPDRLIADTDSVEIKNGLHFYTVPPATFGNGSN